MKPVPRDPVPVALVLLVPAGVSGFAFLLFIAISWIVVLTAAPEGVYVGPPTGPVDDFSPLSILFSGPFGTVVGVVVGLFTGSVGCLGGLVAGRIAQATNRPPHCLTGHAVGLAVLLAGVVRLCSIPSVRRQRSLAWPPPAAERKGATAGG